MEPLFTPTGIDLKKTKCFDVWDRHNLVRIDNLLNPNGTKEIKYDSEELRLLADNILTARVEGRPVIFFYGAHVIKCGLSRIIIDLVRKGFITHLASNGAGSIHDFELAYMGGTSEDVPTAIEDGSFGMWEQTGLWMNKAINCGKEKNMGYGESLAHYVHENQDLFPHKDECVFYNAYLHGIPITYHITIGTDIIHQHPSADFSAIGYCSGKDFSYFANSVKDLEKGVHMNVGSSVTGPEVFLKALSICRNQGHKINCLTTANFDIIPLGDYKAEIGKDTFEYYYRPRKNVINRPVSMGGTGLYIYGNHLETIPSLHYMLSEKYLQLEEK